MFRFNKFNIISTISSLLLMATLIGNYMSNNHKLLNAILMIGIAGQFISIYNIDKWDNYESRKMILRLDLSLVFCAVCMRIFYLMN